MEIPAWLFFSFWATTSTTFLHLAFHALDKTQLSPVFLLLLKHSLAISSCCSSSYALKYRAQSIRQLPSPNLFILYTTLSALLATTTDGILLRGTVTAFYAQLLLMLNSLPIPNLPWKTISRILLGLKIIKYAYSLRRDILSITYSVLEIGSLSLLHLIVRLISTIFSLHFLCYLPVFCISFFLDLLRFSWNFLSFFFEVVLTLGNGDHDSSPERVAILMVLEMSLFSASVEKTGFSPILVLLLSHLTSAFLAEYGMLKAAGSKMIEFAVGIGGAILLQRFTSFGDDEAAPAVFLYLGVMWVANLTLLGFPLDFGIFYFAVGNMVVGCSSWLPFAAALLLFALRIKLESLTLLFEEDDLIQVSMFNH